jgi:hypothetical protein
MFSLSLVVGIQEMSVQEGEKKERYQPHCQLEIKQRMNE